MELLRGATAWSYCVELLCGATVWSYCVEGDLLRGTTAWSYCVESLRGAAAWSYCVELLCGSTVWSYSVELLCGAAPKYQQYIQQCHLVQPCYHDNKDVYIFVTNKSLSDAVRTGERFRIEI